jgi:hypothetical protein
MNNEYIRWFDAFMGVGYNFYEVRPKVLLIFTKRKILLTAWNKIIKWWPDDEIRMRFLETNDSYKFILYGESRILETKWVFLKALKTSEHYKKFKEEYDKVASLRLALYRPKSDSYELEIFDYTKRVTDAQFLKEPIRKENTIISKALNFLHDNPQD